MEANHQLCMTELKVAPKIEDPRTSAMSKIWLAVVVAGGVFYVVLKALLCESESISFCMGIAVNGRSIETVLFLCFSTLCRSESFASWRMTVAGLFLTGLLRYCEKPWAATCQRTQFRTSGFNDA